MSNEIEFISGLTFKFSDDRMKVIAVIEPCENRIELTANKIQQCLAETPFRALYIDELSVAKLAVHYNAASPEQNVEFEIGERRDATCDIHISDDKMKARLILTPNFGGRVLRRETIQKLIVDKNIVFGIINADLFNSMIEETTEKGEAAEFIVAEGLQPIDGVDTKFESLIVPPTHTREPQIDEHGEINYRELGDVLIVHKDEVLMQRIPPIPGIPGRNVLGEVIEPSGGLDIPFSLDQRGIYVNPEDENQLLSNISGQPLVIPNGIVVSPVLTVDNVDFSSGNIRFDGSVVVLGEVISGMKVYALEDIVVNGNVADAQLECKRNLLIKGGVTGNSELIAGADVMVKGGVQGIEKTPHNAFAGKEKRISKTAELPPTVEVDRRKPIKFPHPTKIASRGSVCIGFAENFKIDAAIDIVVDKYVINCELMSANKIVIGSKGGSKKSSIIGGVTWALMMVRAKIIGADTGIKTRVQAGTNPYIQRQIAELRDFLNQNEDEQDNIRKIIDWHTKNPEKNDADTSARLHHTLGKLMMDEATSRAELSEILANVSVISNARVFCERGVYTGTEIKINKAIWKAEENRSKTLFTAEHHKMIVG